MELIREFAGEDLAALKNEAAARERFAFPTKGYRYVDARPVAVALAVVHNRALALLSEAARVFTDSFFLYYSTGFGNRQHVDADRSLRVLVLVEAPAVGGQLCFGRQPVLMSEGDAVVFCPSKERHGVSPLTGRRVVWSVGARLDQDVSSRAR